MIRPITEADRADFLEMAKEFYASDAVAHPIPEASHLKTFEELMRSGDYALCYLIEHEGKPAGYALLAKTFSQEAGGMVLWIEEIYVRPEFRSHGLGKECFAYLKENLDPAVTRLRLEVEDGNEGAIRLYHRLGFTPLEYKQMLIDL